MSDACLRVFVRLCAFVPIFLDRQCQFVTGVGHSHNRMYTDKITLIVKGILHGYGERRRILRWFEMPPQRPRATMNRNKTKSTFAATITTTATSTKTQTNREKEKKKPLVAIVSLPSFVDTFTVHRSRSRSRSRSRCRCRCCCRC